jgi:MerR family redox-sensitive transcriptional activator SoxR
LDDLLSIGEVSRRTGVPATALRFYEAKGLIEPPRASSGHRRYPRDTLRRVSFILAAQRVGLSLRDVRAALSTLPDSRTPTAADWSRLAAAWRPMLDERIQALELLRDRLDSCIGCGCLSLETCGLQNPNDLAAAGGTGPRYLLGDSVPAESG